MHSEADYLSTLLESGHAPGYQQGAFPTPATVSPFNSPRSNLEGDSQPAQSFRIPLRQQNSAASLDPNTSLAGSNLDPEASLPGQSAQPSSDNLNREERLTETEPSGLEITLYPGPMSVAAGGYIAGPMPPNSHQYVWGNRPFQPLQPPSGHMNPQFPPSQPYPSSGFPVGYNGTQSAPMHGYHEPSVPPSYLPGAPGSAQQSQSRSPSIVRPFPPHSGGTLLEQPLMTSPPPYMISQPGYYLADAPPIPSSHQTSMNTRSSSMPTEPVFAASDSNPSAAESDHTLRRANSRPRPQCWEHGCNGREFSTFSNLLRHQRERSGVVAKAECPVCGAVFTRTTARNIHVAQGKCRGPGQESSTE